MAEPNVLRTTKIGGGFVKEDVLNYVDELNSKNYQLQEELDKLKKQLENGGGLSAEKEAEFESELTRLRGELGTTKNQLRAAQEELKNRPVIEVDGEGGAVSGEVTQLRAELEAAKQSATDAQADLSSAQAELELEREEKTDLNNKIVELESRLTTVNEDNEALRGDIATLSAQALTAGGNDEEITAKITELEARAAAAETEAASLRTELEAKDAMLAESAGLSSEADLKKLAESDAQIAEMTAALADKDREISDLKAQIEDLKENGDDGSFDMSAMTALITQAKTSARAMTNDAKKKSEEMLSEANAKAESIVSEANAKAESIIEAANADAEKKTNDADAQAIKIIADAEESVRESVAAAEKRTKTTTETARTVRALLRSEIDSVSKKFNEISLVLENLTGQAGSRLTEAKNVISEARDTVNDDDSLPSFDSFDDVANKSFGKVNKGDFNFDDLAVSAGDSNSNWK